MIFWRWNVEDEVQTYLADASLNFWRFHIHFLFRGNWNCFPIRTAVCKQPLFFWKSENEREGAKTFLRRSVFVVSFFNMVFLWANQRKYKFCLIGKNVKSLKHSTCFLFKKVPKMPHWFSFHELLFHFYIFESLWCESLMQQNFPFWYEYKWVLPP